MQDVFVSNENPLSVMDRVTGLNWPSKPEFSIKQDIPQRRMAMKRYKYWSAS